MKKTTLLIALLVVIGAIVPMAVVCVLYIPPVRKTVLEKAIPVVQEKTGLDINLGDIYLSPFHHSPMVFYRAYKGETDLPLEVNIDSLFVGHRGQDTLLCVQTLRLNAKIDDLRLMIDDFSSTPIEIKHLQLDNVTFHSDSLIAAVGIDALIGHLELSSPELIIAKGQYPLHGLRLYDSYIGIDLRPTTPDTTAQDTTPMLMAFDVPDGDIRNMHFALTPLGMHVRVGSLFTNVLADVGGNIYDARCFNISRLRFGLGNLDIPADTIYGNACVDLARNLITSSGLYVRSDAMGAKADLHATKMNLETMRVDVNADAEYQGSQVRLRAMYDIDDEAYDAHVDIDKVDLSPFLKDSTHVLLAGQIDAEGKGLDPNSRAMRSQINVHLTDAIYDNINVSGMRLSAELADKTVEGRLHLPVWFRDDSLVFRGETEHQFRVTDFMNIDRIGVDYRTQMRNITISDKGEKYNVQRLDLHFTTDSTTALHLATEGLTADMNSPMHGLELSRQLSAFSSQISDSVDILALIDSIPSLALEIQVAPGHPLQDFVDSTRVDLKELNIALHSDSLQKTLSIGAQARLTDGAMSMRGIKTDAEVWFDVEKKEDALSGIGCLTMDNLYYNEKELGSHSIALSLSPSNLYPHSFRADIQPDDIPMEMVESFLQMADIDLRGKVRAQATIDGLPGNTDITAEVLPLNLSALYKPYNVQLSLGETPIVMNHNKVDFNGLPIYGADSTYLALTGGLDLDSMRLAIALAADSFAPAKLVKDGPIPVHGDLTLDIHGNVTGPLDSIVAEVDVTILPVTDITYPIDKKNMAQIKPNGSVNVRYALADSVPLNLGGRININDGLIRYSPKFYPIMPFRVDSGSYVTFHGQVGRTFLNLSASQQIKADVQSEGEETRRVDFRTGVRVKGVVDSIGLNTIGFFLEAPEDEAITRELASLDEETREGLAATLLATGMYVGESNAAQHRDGYALSSIINSRINAAMANSKVGKVVDIDFSNAQTEHAGGKTNDMNISISKSFFKDRFRITVGSTLTDNPDINQTSGLLNNLSAEYKLTKEGNVLLRAYTQRDYNNVLEGELYKSGLGVRAFKDWKHKELYRGDSITRTYNLTADAGVAYRSNNSLGPDASLKASLKNLMGHDETFTIKGNGAYYWALRDRHPGDPKKTDTYKLGANASLIFPYLHWLGDNNPEGDTRYMVGYQYENIAGGYGVHKLTGSFTYFFKSSPYITHAFTPFSLSIVMMKAETDSLLNKAASYPQLIKVIAGNEFVPSIGYTFTYNDYRAKRAVNTMFEAGVKESGNLINSIYCIFGYKWNDKNKPLGSVTFHQFVKMNLELRNKFNFTDKICIATRLFAGANIPLGNSDAAPLSEAFYAGGPNGMRAAPPYAYGPGNFYSELYNQNFFHSGDVKLEANFEFRFPIVWKLFGAAFLDAGNVWNWYNGADLFRAAGIEDYREQLQLRDELYDGIIDNPYFARQIALGTGTGLRLDLDGLVIRFDFGVAIHAPFQTYKYDKQTWLPDKTQPINTYFNIPSAADAIRVNFGIGYPF